MRKRVNPMKVIAIVLIAIILLIALSIVAARIVNACRNKISTENGIQESTYIDVNGIKQFIQIRGENKDNPVMIFIHGGPASPMGYVSQYYQKDLESEITFINYDQRGCGRTYYANGSVADPDIDQLVTDLDGIVDYARDRFGKDKVIIAGHSWGTVVGSIYVQEHPEKVSCYIGMSQITNLYENKLDAARMALSKPAIKGTEDEKKLQELVDRMSQVKSYSEFSLDDLSQLVPLTAKYIACEGEMSGSSQMLTGITSPYMNLDDTKWFLKQMNTKRFFEISNGLMDYAFFGFDIKDRPLQYSVPVYYIAGEGDYAVCQDDVRAYYETIDAPDKAFCQIPNAGHTMFMDAPDKFADTIRDIMAKID